MMTFQKTFDITPALLKAKGATNSGYWDFMKHYPDGCDYNKLLQACTEADRDDYAEWLLRAFGYTRTDLIIPEGEYKKSTIFSGTIKCKGDLCTTGSVQAGFGIKAAFGSIRAFGKIGAFLGNIEASRDIEAGEIEAVSGEIRAGCDIKARHDIEASDDINAG